MEPNVMTNPFARIVFGLFFIAAACGGSGTQGALQTSPTVSPIPTPTPSLTPPPTPGPGLANLWGRVTDDNDHPIAGALVVVEPMKLSTMTSADGRYEILGIPVKPGGYSLVDIEVTKRGFGKWTVRMDPLYSGQNHRLDPRLGQKPYTSVVGSPLAP